MANYRMTLQSLRSQAELFTYMATFSNAAMWNPRVESADSDSGDDLKVGSEFHLAIKIRKKTTPFVYSILEFDPPQRLVVEAVTTTFYIRDTITVRTTEMDHSEMTYAATLRFRGFASILDGALIIVIRQIGRKAKHSLETILSTP